jgi:Uma2 family endonuclease
MGPLALKVEERYSYGDYLTWDDDQRWELIDGIPYSMSPGPNRRHQEISMELSAQFHSYLRGKPCKAYHAPFDVRLPEDDESDDETFTVVQPDLVVVCDPRGVREYWVIDPAGQTVMVFSLVGERRYGRPKVYTKEDDAPVGIFPDFVMNLRMLFTV